MKMSKQLKKAWVKALRSGEYGQCEGTLTDGEGNFCCLGVLQHVASGGSCELDDGTDNYRGYPSNDWYNDNGITFRHTELPPHHPGFNEPTGHAAHDAVQNKLMQLNDDLRSTNFGRQLVHVNNFKAIAKYIEANVETY